MRYGELHRGRSRRTDIKRFTRGESQSLTDGSDILRHDRPRIVGDRDATNVFILVLMLRHGNAIGGRSGVQIAHK